MKLPIIADASPLIVLAQVDSLWLLHKLFSKVLLPPAVHDELEIAQRRPGYQALERSLAEGWLSLTAVPETEGVAMPSLPTGAGERQAILLAVQRSCRFLLIDDRGGRLAAQKLGIPVVGTAGVLLLAKERGLIPSVGQLLDQLAAKNLRLSPGLRNQLLKLAKEAADE